MGPVDVDTLLNLMPDAVALSREDGVVAWASDRFASLVTCSPTEAEGRPAGELLGVDLPLNEVEFAVTHAVGTAVVETRGTRIEGSTVGRSDAVMFLLTSRAVATVPITGALRPGRLASGGRRGRVLVIDDEPTIGKVLERILAEYAVKAVVDAHQALAALEADAFDVIVCDLALPKMSGMEFYGVLRRDRPHMASRVVFLTGGGFTLPSRHFLSSVPNRHLKKPFEAAAVRKLVAEVFESHASSGERARITP